MTTYLLDANVFIEARNRYYGFDFVPGFWEWLTKAHQRGTVVSIAKVRDELRDEELSEWASQRGESFFLKPDDAVFEAHNEVSDWAQGGFYNPAAVSDFFRGADCWLVSHALAYSYVVVTHEVGADTPRKIKIPNACEAHGILCIDTFEMLQVQGARFVLG